MTIDTRPFTDQPIPPGAKGVPAAAVGCPPALAGERGWSLLHSEVAFPAAVLKRSAIDHNRATMRRFLEGADMHLAPHGKTTMAPQLFALQQADGVWGFTAATPAHVMVYRRAGIGRILYANQLVDPAGLSYVLGELFADPDFEFLSLVDSVAGADMLATAAAAHGLARPLDVLIEIGVPGRRCGVRTAAEATALAAAIRDRSPRLRLRGVEAFEGVVSTDGAGLEIVRAQLAIVRALAEHVVADTPSPRPIVSVGGSAFIEQVASEMASWPIEADYILRSGCYITNDHGMYAAAQRNAELRGTLRLDSPLRPAIEVWGHVLSRPEPDRVIVGIGKRDISHDIELPRPIGWVRRDKDGVQPLDGAAEVIGLNDQHAWISIAASHPIAVGDLMVIGCSHPCTTFDKWKYLLMVDNDYRIEDIVTTHF